MEKFLDEARKIAYEEVKKTGMPLKLHVDLATEIGKNLAKKLGADVDVVECGTLLMDCLIGQSLVENKLDEHIVMSLNKANELLDRSSLTEDKKENIRHCILEHHGVDKFYSIESEICCNADCYRFISIKGYSYALRYLRDKNFSFDDLITLLNNKAEEKRKAISLDIVKNELIPQYEIIIENIKYLKGN